MDLPPHWEFAIDTKGRVYYYHEKIRISQWEIPIFIEPLIEIKPKTIKVEIKDEPIEPEEPTMQQLSAKPKYPGKSYLIDFTPT